MLTVTIDSGSYMVVLSSNDDTINVYATAKSNGRESLLENRSVPRSTLPRADLLISGIDAWSRELYFAALKARGAQTPDASSGS